VSKAWAKGSTRAWRKRRALVLAEAGHRCQLRIPGVCTTIATEAHHVHGKSNDDATLAAACSPCNKAVGDPARHNPPADPKTRW